ncbi:hypothetical protein B4168_1823 [Anoxybacillus flavithermus]|nr:hypothetical protein B4168_1823 [Anoxybacillus flavithermus]OAO85478.1 hypothetical protein GT23_2381 [Parageobacillus thermoglucosidasius]
MASGSNFTNRQNEKNENGSHRRGLRVGGPKEAVLWGRSGARQSRLG